MSLRLNRTVLSVLAALVAFAVIASACGSEASDERHGFFEDSAETFETCATETFDDHERTTCIDGSYRVVFADGSGWTRSVADELGCQ
ncbi:hypothetical protein OAV19_00645, partial [bacterium]|nr:hypothetical protein [bacterium]